MAVLSGGALSLSTIAGIMGGCTSGSDTSYSPRTLSTDQDEMVTVIAEHIIPATDTPGAKAARVNQYVDKMLTDWHTDEERQAFLDGLQHVDETSNRMRDRDFMDLDEEGQIAVLKELEQQGRRAEDDARPFFPMMKEMTIVGYYTSEIGASQELQASIIPGYYDGCKPYAEVGTAWSNAGT